MSRLTGIVIAKDEEEMIADCLDSLSFCDERILVDNSSTDRTADIAKHMGVYVKTARETDFARLRTTGLEEAKGAWVFYLDADERVSKKLQDEILKLVAGADVPHSAYRVARQNYYYGKHLWPHVEYMERLFQKQYLKRWTGRLHETPEVIGSIGDLSGTIDHFTHRDLSSMVKKTIVWSRVEAELRLAAGHPQMSWWRFPRVMFTAFFNSYIRQKGYSVGVVGLIESMYQAFSIFITYARLWEMQQEENRQE